MSKNTTGQKTEKQTEAKNPVELIENDLENVQGGVITETFPQNPGTPLKLGGTLIGKQGETLWVGEYPDGKKPL